MYSPVKSSKAGQMAASKSQKRNQLAILLVNKFRMRCDVLTYSMAGMGCSSSLVCIDLAKHLLQALPNRRILVVNHENITNNW